MLIMKGVQERHLIKLEAYNTIVRQLERGCVRLGSLRSNRHCFNTCKHVDAKHTKQHYCTISYSGKFSRVLNFAVFANQGETVKF